MDFYTLMKTSADKEGIPFSEKEFEKFVIYNGCIKIMRFCIVLE